MKSQPGPQEVVAPDPPSFAQCISKKESSLKKGEPRPNQQAFLAQCQQDFALVNRLTMQIVVAMKWYELEAGKRGITISDAAVQSRIDSDRDKSYRSSYAFQQFLARTGETRASLVEIVRGELAQIEIENRAMAGATVSNSEVARLYEQHKDRFHTKRETRDIKIVFAKSRGAAESVRSMIEHGSEWSSASSKYGAEGDIRRAHGTMNGVARLQFDKQLARAIFTATPHRLYGPLQIANGYYVFKVEKVHRPGRIPLREAAPQIHLLLLTTRRRNSVADFRRKFLKNWREKTLCGETYVTNLCANGPKPDANDAPLGPLPPAAPQGG
ncbi:MAG: peptidyl-prolyl cis-trans isomerase [Solirubrobacterales bacterium]